jgi:hypothetical protein
MGLAFSKEILLWTGELGKVGRAVDPKLFCVPLSKL